MHVQGDGEEHLHDRDVDPSTMTSLMDKVYGDSAGVSSPQPTIRAANCDTRSASVQYRAPTAECSFTMTSSGQMPAPVNDTVNARGRLTTITR